LSQTCVGRIRKQLGVVCVKMVVQGNGGDKSTEGSVHNENQRTDNGALDNTAGRSIQEIKVDVMRNSGGCFDKII